MKYTLAWRSGSPEQCEWTRLPEIFGSDDGDDIRERARRVEALGYKTLVVESDAFGHPLVDLPVGWDAPYAAIDYAKDIVRTGDTSTTHRPGLRIAAQGIR